MASNPLLENVLKDEESTISPLESPVGSEKIKKSSFAASWWIWFMSWTEDGIGVALAFVLFLVAFIVSACGQDMTRGYSATSEWPLGGISFGLGVIVIAHYVLKKKLEIEAYCVVLLISVVARSIGNYDVLKEAGLSASLWAILIGITCRFFGIDVKSKGIFSGEFFVKVGVTLLAMDFTSIVAIGLPGLLVAWGDTLLILGLGTYACITIAGFDQKDGIVIAGATSICGSSAATALSSSVHEKGYKDEVCRTIIAIMGVFNAPLMPIMPLFKTLIGLNPIVVGAWIGGSIDSTGQVTASAEMGGDQVLKSAIIIKMAQNLLIGPLCLFFTSYFQHSFQVDILISKFPLFVMGFLVTSTVATILLQTSWTTHDLQNNIITNSWCISEWMTLLGFACIGLEIDIRQLFNSKQNQLQSRVLSIYLLIQTMDLMTTFGFAYLMFHNQSTDDDDNTDHDDTNNK